MSRLMIISMAMVLASGQLATAKIGNSNKADFINTSDLSTASVFSESVGQKTDKFDFSKITTAVLFHKNAQGKSVPACFINTVGQTDLVPGFLSVATSNENSDRPSGIRACDDNELALAGIMAESSVEAKDAKVALAVTGTAIVGALLVCALPAVVGALSGAIEGHQENVERNLLTPTEMGVSPANIGMGAGFIKGASLAASVPGSAVAGAIGAAAGVFCSSVGEFLGFTGVKYFDW